MVLRFSTIELKDDTIIVVLGASGDLAKKKTVSPPPRGYTVCCDTDLPDQFPALFGLVCDKRQ